MVNYYLLEIIKKHKTEKYLFPCSNKRQKDLPDYMGTNDFQLTEAVMYETVSADLSDLENVFYDVLAFYSPSGITSLFENFPEFKQNNTRIFEKNTRAMITKLTLTVEKSVIDQAKIVAKASGRSLSKMVEEYLVSLNRASQIIQEDEDDLNGLLALRGCIKLPNNLDIDDLRYQAIMEKHG